VGLNGPGLWKGTGSLRKRACPDGGASVTIFAEASERVHRTPSQKNAKRRTKPVRACDQLTKSTDFFSLHATIAQSKSSKVCGGARRRFAALCVFLGPVFSWLFMPLFLLLVQLGMLIICLSAQTLSPAL
jgi:hypothetical protein